MMLLCIHLSFLSCSLAPSPHSSPNHKSSPVAPPPIPPNPSIHGFLRDHFLQGAIRRRPSWPVLGQPCLPQRPGTSKWTIPPPPPCPDGPDPRPLMTPFLRRCDFLLRQFLCEILSWNSAFPPASGGPAPPTLPYSSDALLQNLDITLKGHPPPPPEGCGGGADSKKEKVKGREEGGWRVSYPWTTESESYTWQLLPRSLVACYPVL